MRLRDYQSAILTSAFCLLDEGEKRIVIKAPTGAGKTLIAALLIQHTLNQGGRAAFVVPTISLVDQTVRAFWDLGLQSVGVVQANHEMTDYAQPVQICSKDTLSRRKHFPLVDLVVVDECHVQSQFLFDWMAGSDLPFVGLSATPWTKGLGKHYKRLINHVSTASLIRDGYLSQFEVWSPSAPDLAKIKTVAGDYDQKELGKRSNDPGLIADIVSTWLKLGNNEPTLCYAVDRAHAQSIHDQFEQAEVGVAYCDAFTTREEREQIRLDLESGKIRVVCNIGTLTTGIDWDVRCIILARATKSSMLYVQIIGRGLRTAQGKEKCIILDHSDTTHRLGFVTDVDRDDLDLGEAKIAQPIKKEKLPKICPNCKFTKPVGVHACPKCGYAPERVSKIEPADGELHKHGERKPLSASREEMIKFQAQMLWFCRKHGHKDGFAYYLTRARYGDSAHTAWKIAPLQPDEVAHRWYSHLLIKAAKRKKRGLHRNAEGGGVQAPKAIAAREVRAVSRDWQKQR